jgi:CHAT domain-containing protein/tetratricopeptide (TPR) repeat protein
MLAVYRVWRSVRFVALLVLVYVPPLAVAAQTQDLLSLMQRITELSRAGRYADAISLGQQLVAEAEKMAGKEHPMVAMTLFTLAELHRMQGDLAEAEPMLKRVLAMREKALGPDHADVAATLASLSFLAVTQADYRLAEQYVERALAIRTRALGSEHPDTAMTLVTLGRVRQHEARYADAEQLYQQALGLFEKALGPEHMNVAVALNNLSQVYKEQGRLTLAEGPLRRALSIQEKQFGPDSIFIAAMLNNLGELHRRMGRHAEAEALYRREQQISEKALGPDHPEVATSLSNLATLFTAMGRASEAEGLLRRALIITEKAFGPQHPDVATALNNLADALSGMNRTQEAEALFRRSLAIRERHFGDESVSVAIALDNLASLLHQERRYAEAEPLARRSLAIRERAFGPEHLITSNSLNNLASLLDNLKRHREAEPMLRRAVVIREAALGDRHPDVAISMHNLASHHLDVQEWQAAYATFKRATTIWITRAGGRTGGFLRQDERAEVRRNADPFLGFVVAAYHVARGADGETEQRLRTEAFETAQWVTELGAAAAISGMSARVAAGGDRLGQLVRTRQDLAEEGAAVDRELIAAVSRPAQARKFDAEAALRQQAAAITTRLKEVDAALDRSFPQYTSLASAAPVPLTEIGTLIGPGEALLLFVPTRDGTFLWAITRAQSRWIKVPLSSSELVTRVAALRCGLDYLGEWRGEAAGKCTELLQPASAPHQETALPFDLARAHELYTALFGSVEDLIADKQLLIVASGPLTSLPFHVLVTEPAPIAIPTEPGGYGQAAWLAKRAAITVLPSVASLKALRQLAKQSRATDPFVGFGNPLLTGQDGTDRTAWTKQSCPSSPALAVARADRRGRPMAKLLRGGVANPEELRRQPPLAETADELCAVARLLGAPGSAVHLGQGATERTLKALSAAGTLARARVVHFATHGLLAAETEAVGHARSEPALILTPPDKASDEDDGLLTASEVMQLKLDADWVVLSACNTAAAASDMAGAEALSGLARAFFYAGARALLVSHWAVDSEATVELITKAFNEIKADRKVARAEALRRSMFALIGRGGRHAHPALWAPFVVVGEGAR